MNKIRISAWIICICIFPLSYNWDKEDIFAVEMQIKAAFKEKANWSLQS